MKIKAFGILAAFLVCASTFAQDTQEPTLKVKVSAHSVVLSSTASTTVGANYHFWRASCGVTITSTGICPFGNEGTFFVIGTTGTTTFTDSTVVSGSNYSYYVTAFCPTSACASNFLVNVDSPPSNHLGAAIPGDPVGTPTLSITSISTNFNDTQETLTTEWYDPSSGPTTFVLTDASGNILRQGGRTSGNGHYIMQWAGPIQTLMMIKICNAVPTCILANIG